MNPRQTGAILRCGLPLLVATVLTGCAHATRAESGLIRGEYAGPCGPGLPGEAMSGKAEVTQSGRAVRAVTVTAGKYLQVALPPGTYKVTLPGAGYYIVTVKRARTTTLPLRICL